MNTLQFRAERDIRMAWNKLEEMCNVAKFISIYINVPCQRFLQKTHFFKETFQYIFKNFWFHLIIIQICFFL